MTHKRMIEVLYLTINEHITINYPIAVVPLVWRVALMSSNITTEEFNAASIVIETQARSPSLDEKIHAVIQWTGFSQRQAAEYLGISRRSVARRIVNKGYRHSVINDQEEEVITSVLRSMKTIQKAFI